jgi:hypothetical protein
VQHRADLVPEGFGLLWCQAGESHTIVYM